MEIIKKLNMKTKKMKKKQIKKFIKKELKAHIEYERMMKCEEILEKNGIKIEKGELTLKEISAYKKMTKNKAKFSKKVRKAIKKYFKYKIKETKDSIKISKSLKKFDNMPFDLIEKSENAEVKIEETNIEKVTPEVKTETEEDKSEVNEKIN
jgi:flagellar biosynthesis component FlhA